MTQTSKTAMLMKKLAGYDCIVSIREPKTADAPITIVVLNVLEAATVLHEATEIAKAEDFKVTFSVIEEE
jgi:hypothetical protein